MDYSPSGSSIRVLSQARILEWVAISFSRASFLPRNQNCVSCLAGGFFATEAPGKPQLIPYTKTNSRQIKAKM